MLTLFLIYFTVSIAWSVFIITEHESSSVDVFKKVFKDIREATNLTKFGKALAYTALILSTILSIPALLYTAFANLMTNLMYKS